MTITREEFIDLVGEDPEDMFGPDWENEVEEFMDDLKYDEHPRPEEDY